MIATAATGRSSILAVLAMLAMLAMPSSEHTDERVVSDYEAAFADLPAFDSIPPLLDETFEVRVEPPPSEEHLARRRAIEDARSRGALGTAVPRGYATSQRQLPGDAIERTIERTICVGTLGKSTDSE